MGEIAARLEIRQPQASKHLKVLSDAGLIEVEAIANRRVCTLRAEPFQELDQWLGRYRQLWEDRYDRLEDFLKQIQQQQDSKKSDPPRPTTDPSHPDSQD